MKMIAKKTLFCIIKKEILKSMEVSIMKRKNGFTLIELLAVIVILTVIALITTPIILNVINNAKRGASKNSMYGYVQAIELESAKEFLTQKIRLTGTFTTKNGNLYLGNEKVLEVSFKGSKPENGGTVELVSGRVNKAELIFNGHVITYDGSVVGEIQPPTPTQTPTPKPTPKPSPVYDFAVLSGSSFGNSITLEKRTSNSAMIQGSGGRSASGTVVVTGKFNANQQYSVSLKNNSGIDSFVSILQTDVTTSSEDSQHITFIPKQEITQVFLSIQITNPCCGELVEITLQ